MTSRPRHTASPHPLDAPEVMFGLFGSGLGLGLGSGFGLGLGLGSGLGLGLGLGRQGCNRVHDLVA